ncbi:AAA family ATPase [Paenibacillus enshidis]|uniref:AAA family ATPase n=1 Tax=Paenibacillus enshidis TaxID=1458439 RepID=A0ABV5AVE0_9BACL
MLCNQGIFIFKITEGRKAQRFMGGFPPACWANPMKLQKIELAGFKNLIDHSFTFGLKNLIQGERSCGKTALLEAIVWCLGGCDLSGNTRNVTKRYKNTGTKMMTVTTYWEFQYAGQRRHEVISRSASRRTTIRRNHQVVTQESIDELFGSIDTFLSVFLPGYLSGLPAARFSNVILSMLPSPDADISPLMMKLQDLTEELSETEEYIKDRKHRLRTMKLQQSISKDDQLLKSQLQEYEAKLRDIRGSSSLEKPAFIQEMENERKELGERYRALVAEWQELFKHSGPVQKLEDIRKECQSLLDRGFVLKDEIESSTMHYQEELAQFQNEQIAEEQSLLIEIQKLKNQLKLNEKYSNKGQMELIYKNIKEALEEGASVKEQILSLKEDAVKYAQQQVDTANLHLKDCSIQMTKKESHGQILFKYQLMYRGVDFYSLSVSEKVICSLELSELLYQIKQESIPVFIDGMTEVRGNVKAQLFLTKLTTDATIIVA